MNQAFSEGNIKQTHTTYKLFVAPPHPPHHASDNVKNPVKVTRSRFEIEQEGHLSYLEFETDGHGWMTIWHTEVAKELRGKGIGLELVTTAFQYARENSLRVDVVCPLAKHLIEKHPEFKPLLGNR